MPRNKPEPKLWGCSPQGVEPLPPSDEDLKSKFIWDFDRTLLVPPPVRMLVPSEPAIPPPGWKYPQASTYMCNEEFDPQFASGWYFYSDYNTSDAPQLRKDLSCITTPPNIGPTGWDDHGNFIQEPVPGMNQLIPGYPLVKFINGDRKRLVTEACLQTPQSLQRWPMVYAQFMELIKKLMPLIWGCAGSNSTSHITPLFEYVAVHNGRSPGQAENSFDGSYNLAATSSEGQGAGLFMPGVQADSSEARAVIAQVLEIIHQLYRLIMPLCISKLEWDVIEFHGLLCNIMSFGGFEPGPTACQLNVSSSFQGGDLAKFIGNLQGSWHVDEKDDACRWTLLIVFFRLPEGDFIHIH
jgi:hypothetical protein